MTRWKVFRGTGSCRLLEHLWKDLPEALLKEASEVCPSRFAWLVSSFFVDLLIAR